MGRRGGESSVLIYLDTWQRKKGALVFTERMAYVRQ